MREITSRPSRSIPNSGADGSVRETMESPTGYQTSRGQMVRGAAEEVLSSPTLAALKGTVQLIFTSPPFPLNKKKKYGNLQGEAYIDWLASFAPILRDYIPDDGSIVIELGNAWEPGRPVMSTLALRSLLVFLERADLRLCQQFVCYNPARLPSPAQWVTIERIRVKDAYTNVWWLSPSDRPKADNRRVLKPYSPRMLELLDAQHYNTDRRPSNHHIGATSFLTNNGGAIPANVLQFSNTGSMDDYQRYCREHKLQAHPARMPIGLPEFFINFLTQQGDLVLDPFAGSNTTGAVAERLARRWLSIELREDYILGSKGRFPSLQLEALRGED